jgi:hypothetical protein
MMKLIKEMFNKQIVNKQMFLLRIKEVTEHMSNKTRKFKIASVLAPLLVLVVLLAGCTSRWEEEERIVFLLQCQMAMYGAGEVNNVEVCDCMVKKLEARYPNPNDIDSLSGTRVALFALAGSCRNVQIETVIDWNEQDSLKFMAGCKKWVKPGHIASVELCPCIYTKHKVLYPTIEKHQRIRVADYAALGRECAKEMQ